MSRELELVQQHFHALIRSRAGSLVDKHETRLPELMLAEMAPGAAVWFPIPGMSGGFSYRLLTDREGMVLQAYSWSRVIDGSEQCHEVTPSGYERIE